MKIGIEILENGKRLSVEEDKDGIYPLEPGELSRLPQGTKNLLAPEVPPYEGRIFVKEADDLVAEGAFPLKGGRKPLGFLPRRAY